MRNVTYPLEDTPQGLLDSARYLNMDTEEFFDSLVRTGILRTHIWRRLPLEKQQEIVSYTDHASLLASLEKNEVLTRYQAERIRTGKCFGLTLGNYRILNRIGAGGMGIVFQAEHFQLPRLVAIKTVTANRAHYPILLDRFLFEMETISKLQHPNIVAATDAGMVRIPDDEQEECHYVVMDYIDGKNLEELVEQEGALEPIQACDIIYQIASALAEAHRLHFVHRDLKPSNIIVMPDGKAKLLDFGLGRNYQSNLTEPGVIIGTVDFLAPEQAEDARSVDHRADIFGLGGTFFWCLTGRLPFPSKGSIIADLTARLAEPALSIKEISPEIPGDLAAIVSKMLELNPNDRFQNANEVMRALMPFLNAQSSSSNVPGSPHASLPSFSPQHVAKASRILIIDDESSVRQVCEMVLKRRGHHCDQAEDGEQGLAKLKAGSYDLALIDVDMPRMSGLQVFQHIQNDRPSPYFKVIMISGRRDGDELAQLLATGADDYLVKPMRIEQLSSRVKSCLDLKQSQDRSDQLILSLGSANKQLEQNLTALDGDLIKARNALVLALAEMVSSRDSQVGQHLRRMQLYCKALAEEASHSSVFSNRIDETFIYLLECCAPLHDVGKVGLPDHILLKPGQLDPNERVLMQTHTTIGAETLKKVAAQHSFSSGFFQMAIDIARHHHERFDGTGYPDRLVGDAIPLSARFVTLADSYDALRSRRPYKPALSHAVVIQMMTQPSEGQFDPKLLGVLNRCNQEMERIYREYPD